MTLRRAEIIGRLGSTPDLRATQNGTPVTSVGVATEEYRDDEAVWVEVELWGGAAETFAEHASKGDQIRAAGRLELDQWDGGAKLKVVIGSHSDWTFVGGGGGGSEQSDDSPPPAEPKGDQTEPFDDDEIPF